MPTGGRFAVSFDNIERFYTPRRRDSKLRYLSPTAFQEPAMRT